MSDNSPLTTTQFLKEFGLQPDQIKIYLTLTQHGPLTILELSRKTQIKRTTIYRLVESMHQLQLVEQTVDEHRTLIQAIPPSTLRTILSHKQDQISRLVAQFPQVQSYLDQQIHRRTPDTNVKFYRGKSGMQQMAYNVLRANKTIDGYTSIKYESAVGKKTAEYVFKEIIAENIFVRDIYSDRYLESIGGIENLNSKFRYSHHTSNFSSRFIPQEELDITVQTDLYNNCIAIYNWTDDDVFGVEIYNSKLVTQQKQIFELIWSLATPEADLVT